MKCKACQAEGETSCVYPGGSSTTLKYCAPFYDERGEYHHHDSNTTRSHYKCSRGHEWTEEGKRRGYIAFGCDWGCDQ